MTRPKHGGNLDWAASLAGCPTSSILDFSASINPLGPPESALAAIRDHLNSLVRYPDPAYRELCTALARYHDLPIEWILPGNGVAELLTWAGRELAERSTTHLLAPFFADYRRALNGFGARTREHPLDLAALALSDVSGGGLLLNNPHNPTGKLWTAREIEPFLDRFDLVVIDEAFMDFLPPERQETCIPLLEKYPNLVILRSLTKFYSLPGLRLGYALSRPDRLAKWREWRDPWPVNTLAAVASIACLRDTDFQQRAWNWLAPTRERLFQALAGFPGLYPFESVANFLLVRSDSSCLPIQEFLLKNHRILIRDCLSFPELGEHYFRVAVRTEAENQRLISALAGVNPRSAV
ncbi:threonine-phosphate decarboxylase CobD [Pannus brasiliensis CCIBt3594]|uniref:threonine-phosphate decarboxylase n=1 Tax=Pannus brasiliensis CCIBt3594 TaxID=1427578 RepID=A0AAW9QG07_9CHRO